MLATPGQPLAESARRTLEPGFGHDFGGVRVHDDSKAADSASAVSALAYTVGNHIVFGAGQYSPGTSDGNRLLAHELTHTIQQTGGSPSNNIRRLQQSRITGLDVQLSQGTLQRVHLDNAGRKAFDCPDYAGDQKLEDCLNDKDRLSPGEHSPTVAKVQKGLLRDGEDLGPDGVDGKYGPATGKAVVAFKTKYNLGFEQFPDVGPGTMTKLDEMCPAVPQQACPQCPEDPRTAGCPACPPASCPPCPEDPRTAGCPACPEPSGPVKPPNSPFSFCVPFSDRLTALQVHVGIVASVFLFTDKFGKDVQDLWMKYLNNPKTGTKGTLPPRQLFANQTSRVVNEFRQDPETQKQRDRIMKLIAGRVRGNPALMPPVGASTSLLGFREVLNDSELLDLPMSFGDPGNKIPGLIAGGHGKAASDAGDDVRNVDGKFIATNLGLDTIRIGATFTFDVLDCVDFCPGASGSGFALGLTIPMSKLEATPDVPTYDVPFEVIYGLSDLQVF